MVHRKYAKRQWLNNKKQNIKKLNVNMTDDKTAAYDKIAVY